MKIGVLDSNGAFNNPFFKNKKITKLGNEWKDQEYSTDMVGFTHAEYVCSFILKENPDAEIVLVPIVKKNKKSSVLDLIKGIKVLMEEKVDIINMSLGDEYRYHVEVEEICRVATEQGILLVSAYSNQKSEVTYPASLPFVLGVKCLDIEDPRQVLFYNETSNDIIFFSKYFSLYHLGIPKFYSGNSFACAVVTGYLSNYEREYKRLIFQFINSTFNKYYPYQLLKQKKCYFLTNRMEEALEQRFIREVINAYRCEEFKVGIENLEKSDIKLELCPVIFIDHNNYQEICKYKEQITNYAAKYPKKEIVLRYPLFSIAERLCFQKGTNRILNQFTI